MLDIQLLANTPVKAADGPHGIQEEAPGSLLQPRLAPAIMTNLENGPSSGCKNFGYASPSFTVNSAFKIKKSF